MLLITTAFAQEQYNSSAGKSKVAAVPKDNFGNAKGEEYDLAKNGAFKKAQYKNVEKILTDDGKVDEKEIKTEEQRNMVNFYNQAQKSSQTFSGNSGYANVNSVEVQNQIKEGKPVVDGKFTQSTVLVLQFYVDSQFNFEEPRKALELKGFSVYRYMYFPPTPEELDKALALSTQIWIISDKESKLSDEHVKVIKKHYDQGKGLYLWGDNDPFYADVNKISKSLFDAELLGNYTGDQTIGLKENKQDKSGVVANHLISTGIERIFEGITISDVRTTNPDLKPLIYDTEGKIVASIYDKGGKRCIIDGGFTRLYYKWNTAGTDRYVKNAAAWLTNVENTIVKK